ncbi:MAG: hypothetical protein VX737_01055, partial [Pseudomonadota bacterium]|nr:hypothetical protein [Pseudomonadota bacterium]
PITGERSDAPNTIFRYTFEQRRKVDPVTGKPSDASDAITQNCYHSRKLVDPRTGEISNASDAIPRYIFHKIRPVDPVTGKPSDAPNAISRAEFYRKKRAASSAGEPSDGQDVISTGGFFHKQNKQDACEKSADHDRLKRRKKSKQIMLDEQFQVDIIDKGNLPVASDNIAMRNLRPVKEENGFKSRRMLLNLDVSDDNLTQTMQKVNNQAKISKDIDSDNCEIQAARFVRSLQGRDISSVSMKIRGVNYFYPENRKRWGSMIGSDLVKDNYLDLVRESEFILFENDVAVLDITEDRCVTDVVESNGINSFFAAMNIEKEMRLNEKRGYAWGLMGLDLGGVWHQVVWIERENDYVICDPNGVSGTQDKLLKHDQLISSYSNLSRISVLKFSGGYYPAIDSLMKKNRKVSKVVKQEEDPQRGSSYMAG